MNLNISAAKDFLKCETYAHFLHDKKRVRISQRAQALTTGTIWHKIMDPYLLREDIDEADTIAATECSRIADGKLHDAVVKDLTGLMLGLEVWKKPVDWEIHSTETVLSAPLGDHTLVGTLDGIAKWNGFWWHIQHKTIGATQKLDTYWEHMQRDWHECGYEFLAKSHGFEPYGGTLLLTARKLPIIRAQNARQSIIAHNFLSRPQQVVDKAVTDLLDIANRWEVKAGTGAHAFVQNRDQCTGPYRNSPCPYIGVCNGVHSLADPIRYEDAVARYVTP